MQGQALLRKTSLKLRLKKKNHYWHIWGLRTKKERENWCQVKLFLSSRQNCIWMLKTRKEDGFQVAINMLVYMLLIEGTYFPFEDSIFKKHFTDRFSSNFVVFYLNTWKALIQVSEECFPFSQHLLSFCICLILCILGAFYVLWWKMKKCGNTWCVSDEFVYRGSYLYNLLRLKQL